MKNKVAFRVWDGKKMWSWQALKALKYGLLFEKQKGVIALQYVQAQDVNGKKIYEGDILSSQKNDSTYIVEDLINFHLWCYSNSIDTHLSHKVIGNVYEGKK